MNLKTDKKLIAIVGPTASGKTSLGVFLAKKFNGEIVSADSRQVYRGLDIGTGKDLKEYGDIKYHLIDICDPIEKFTMFDWLERARAIIDGVFSHGKVPIIVGGTGLYIQALLEGFQLKPDNSQFPISNFQSNSKIQNPKYQREELEKMPLSKLQSLANKLKPKAYNLDMNNSHRLIRFIERAQSGEQMTKKRPDFEALQIGLNLPREELYQKIDQRVDQWFKDGIIKEVEDLLSSGVDPEWLIKIGLEYRIITLYIIQKSKIKNQKYNLKFKKLNENLEIDKLNENCKLEIENYEFLDDMKQQLKYKTHAYARRQLTWFRRFPEIEWIKNRKEAELLVKKYL